MDEQEPDLIPLPYDSKQKKTLPPFLDWLIGVFILIGVVGGIFYVLTSEGLAERLGKTIFTVKGGIVTGVIMVIIATIKHAIHTKKIREIRDGIREKMEKDWGGDDV